MSVLSPKHLGRLMVVFVMLALLVTACAPAPAPPTPTPPPAPKPQAPAPTAVTKPAPAATAPAPTVAPKPGPGATAPAPTTAPKPAAGPKEEVSMRFAIATSGTEVPYHVAYLNGYYDEVGLAVKLADGTGSATTIQLVGNGAETFGVGDAGTLAVQIAQGIPVKMVAGLVQENPMGVVSLKEKGITKPKDIEGKTIAYNAGGAAANVFPAYAAANNVDISKVTLTNMSQAARLTAIMEKKVDGALEFLSSAAVPLEARGFEINVQLYAKYGVNTMGVGLIANTSYLAQKPDVVRRFVAATLKGWEFSEKNPQEATNIVVKKFPQLDPKVTLGQLRTYLNALHTPRTVGKPVGWMAPEDWDQTLSILTKYAELKERKELDRYFTNEFIPSR